MSTPDDPRIGDLLGRLLAGAAARVAIVGFPSDEGVRRNGGRPGAAAGPTEIRRFLTCLVPDARSGPAFVDLVERTQDLGDVSVSGDLEADQERLAEVVAGALGRGAFVIVLGGGHETAYGHFLGYVRAGRRVAIVNWDAHPDVRPLRDGRGHSGSPFRQALLHPSGLCRGYRVAGLMPHSAAAAHLAFIDSRRGGRIWRADLTPKRIGRVYATARGATARKAEEGGTLVSFDLDAVDQSQAPGVSAPTTGGMSADQWLAAAYLAGRSRRVASCDVVELNPTYDRDGQTARLAALTVWQVLRGLCQR